jgi:hypothetical protein
MRFRLLEGGSHSEAGKEYKSGDVIESDRDLCVVFPLRFQRLPDNSSRVVAEEEEVVEPVPERTSPSKTELTVDATMSVVNVPTAAAKGLRVYKRGKEYVVFDGDGTQLNTHTISTRVKLETFLEELPS